MNVMQTGLLLTGAVIAWNAFNKAQASGTLNFYPASVSNISFDGITPVISLGIMAQNPSGQSFTVNSLVGNLFANDTLIGNVSSFTNTTIQPNSQQLYTVNVRMSLLGIVTDLIKSFRHETGLQQEIEFNAWANVNGYTLPLKLKYKVGQ
jgi:hypothetical protein